MSALPPKADIGERNWDVRFVPQADIDHCVQSSSWALSTLPPTVTGLAPVIAKAMTHGTVPLFTQLWIVPRCTSTSPALRCTLVLSSSMSISPEITVA
jgi:hypothetical protein